MVRSDRREALKYFAAAGAAATLASVSFPPLMAKAATPGAIADYDFIVTSQSGSIVAFDPGGNQIASGSDWGALINTLLSTASTSGVRIHTKAGLYQQSTNVSIPSAFNGPVVFTGDGMARTPQAKFTAPRPSTTIKNTTSGGRVIDTPGTGQSALYIRDMTLYNAGGGASMGINFRNALEGGVERVMVTQVDPTVPFTAEPPPPAAGSIGIYMGTGTGKNLFRLQQVYVIRYDTGILINSDWVVGDQIELNWCNTRCVDIEGGFYQEFRFLHSFDCGGTMVYDNKGADSGFQRELTTILGLADEGKPPPGYVAKAPTVNNVKGAFMLILGTFNPAGTGQGYLSGNLSNVYGFFTDVPAAGGGSAIPGPAGVNSAMKTLTGTTSGSVSYSMPFSGPSLKKFMAYLNGYQNASATPQSISFPFKFTQPPIIAADATAGAKASLTGVTLPSLMGSPVSGWLIIEGF